MVPPRRGRLVGEGDYRAIGKEFVTRAVEYAGLVPQDRVLDIGCGSGRIALALMDYLDANGSYSGFDVNRKGIDFATKTIGRRSSRFDFRWIDARNEQYNPAGSSSAATLPFPYDDGSFSCALAISLFTHLRADEARHYIDQIHRVLGPGGRLLATFFLLNDAARDAIHGGIAALTFEHVSGPNHYEDGTRVGPGVAFNESEVRSWLSASGLELVEPIHHGSWARHPDALSYQDMIVARRR